MHTNIPTERVDRLGPTGEFFLDLSTPDFGPSASTTVSDNYSSVARNFQLR